jgi:hypothetical protein
MGFTAGCHHLVTPVRHNGSMNSAPEEPEPQPSRPAQPHQARVWQPLERVGDEAVLPAGTRLADEARPGRQCFVIIDGAAAVEAAGQRVRDLGAGAFVGSVDRAGRPAPPGGLTVRLLTRSRVLVIDAMRLAVLIDSDQAAAAAWRLLRRRAGPGQPSAAAT